MNVVDIAILLFALIALVSGYRQGLVLTLGQYVGLMGGLLAGAIMAPHLLGWMDIGSVGWRVLATVLIVILCASLGHRLGDVVASPFSHALRRLPFTAVLDRAGGAAVSLVIALVVAWAVASSLANSTGRPAEMIQQSIVVRELDALAPPAPDLLTNLQALLSEELGPNVFVGLEPALPAPLSVDPTLADRSAVVAAARSVVRIEGRGCGGKVSGSGFPIAPNLILTNAHVVAGTSQTTVTTSRGRFSGHVTLFDPARDIAVIQVQGLNATPLVLADGSRGTLGAVIGYPGGGPEHISAAVINARMSARGEDIFGRDTVSRDVLVVGSDIQPGDSGGPVVDGDGAVIGVVFARSLAHPGQGFALSLKEITPDLQSIEAAQPIFDEGRFQCASSG